MKYVQILGVKFFHMERASPLGSYTFLEPATVQQNKAEMADLRGGNAKGAVRSLPVAPQRVAVAGNRNGPQEDAAVETTISKENSAKIRK